jgi:zinc/manganese transport system substrate-binding protein
MKKYYLLLITLVFLSPALQARLNVFACEPEWASLVEELAGDRASVFTATTAHQDVHHIQARPSLIAQLRRADLLVCTGAGLELGWLPMLQRRSSNPRVLPGASGYFEAASHVSLLGKPARLDRAEGDVHAEGNPHIQMDPDNYPPIARALTDRLILLDAEHADDYRRRNSDFITRWETAIANWAVKAAPLKQMPIVVYHDSWPYMNRWLDLQQLATLESKPGVPPTSGQLSALLKRMQQDPARAIIRAPYQDARAVRWLHDRTGIPEVKLPYTVGGNEQATDLFKLFDSTIDLLLGVSR